MQDWAMLLNPQETFSIPEKTRGLGLDLTLLSPAEIWVTEPNLHIPQPDCGLG
jgi:hypothetical protein